MRGPPTRPPGYPRTRDLPSAFELAIIAATFKAAEPDVSLPLESYLDRAIGIFYAADEYLDKIIEERLK